ncbi:hypothetical protein V8D89_003534 [Ganoderma adspersum]
MAYYAFNTAFKSSVIGGSWSTPYGTRFFVRWGDTSLKVPMAALRQEYEAWEKFRRERHPEPEPEPEPPMTPAPAPLPSFSYGTFDWADDVEQEFFSSTGGDDSNIFTDSNLDSNLDADLVDSPIVDQVVAEGVAVVGAGTTLCTIPEEGEEEDVTGEDETGDLGSIDLSDPTDYDSDDSTDSDRTLLADDNDRTILAECNPIAMDDSDSISLDNPIPTPLDDPTPPTSSTPTDINAPIYRIINIDTTGTNFSLHMVQDDGASDATDSKTDTDTTDPAATAKELFDTIQLLSTAGLLNLNTYATVFDTVARACAAGLPFWLHDPLGDREIFV